MSVAQPTAAPGAGRIPTAIVAATERLLQERPMRRLRVGDITAAAGISRTSFYAHFPSKTAVIAECLRRVMDQVTVAAAPIHSTAAGDAEAAIRLGLRQWVEVCSEHGALLRTVSEEWPHDAELRELWLSMMEAVAAGTANVIRSARVDGRAPAGADAATLSACLVWGYERVLHVSLVGQAAGLPAPEAIVEPLTQIMLGGVYGRPLAAAA